MTDNPLFAGVEFGGTKVLALLGTGPDEIIAEHRIPTSTPRATLRAICDFFSTEISRGNEVAAAGIGAFGPVELRRGKASYGHIGSTPKPGWSGTNVVGPIRDVIGAPTAIDTDVSCAALGEGAWGAASDVDSFVYLTVGTGIGGGAVIDGKPIHGLVHPEMGHVTVPRHPDDRYEGRCPFHGDCLEGMASGPAIAERWGSRAEDLSGPVLERAVELEAWYLAAALRSIVYVLAPERIVIGGGVSRLAGLIPAIRRSLAVELSDYPGLEEHRSPDFVVPAGLRDMAGPLGALVIARNALVGGRAIDPVGSSDQTVDAS